MKSLTQRQLSTMEPMKVGLRMDRKVHPHFTGHRVTYPCWHQNPSSLAKGTLCRSVLLGTISYVHKAPIFEQLSFELKYVVIKASQTIRIHTKTFTHLIVPKIEIPAFSIVILEYSICKVCVRFRIIPDVCGSLTNLFEPEHQKAPLGWVIFTYSSCCCI